MPAVAVEAAVKVSVEVPAPVIEVGLKAAVTPLGKPLAASVTGELKPPVTDSVTVEVPVLPAVTLAAVAESEKLGVVDPTSVLSRFAPFIEPQPVTRSKPVTAE